MCLIASLQRLSADRQLGLGTICEPFEGYQKKSRRLNSRRHTDAKTVGKRTGLLRCDGGVHQPSIQTLWYLNEQIKITAAASTRRRLAPDTLSFPRVMPRLTAERSAEMELGSLSRSQRRNRAVSAASKRSRSVFLPDRPKESRCLSRMQAPAEAVLSNLHFGTFNESFSDDREITETRLMRQK